ncbi:unnamed protein product [Rotaria sp. Silwood1]|nr:unnamed protein product [Rotaria sp. Silwood1]CAF1649377.1 unnamed protein product [Rotaria sp. Silwood1]CAF3789463.1 unnamed protein product [Rotaria sp. Silwood1]CAF3824642.1 unnamed protein product [Rotaria sp. Silwood1]CAF3846057.1 unnamed protein product [Rotaria sp. Silwood1]
MKCKVGSTGGPHRGECVKKSLMMTTNPDMLEECAQIVANARHIVCFTGAGMSTESGWFGTPIGWKWTPGFA